MPNAPVAHCAERGRIGERVIHIQQEQCAHPWRGLLPFVVYFDGLLIGNRLGVVFELPRVVAKGFHNIVRELPVALPGVIPFLIH